MEKVTDFFDTWLKSQEKFVENWTEAAKKAQDAFLNLAGTGEGTSDAAGYGFFTPYNSWCRAVAHALREAGGSSVDTLKDTLAKTFSSSNAYMKVYDLWLPFVKAFQERISDPAYYRELIDPAKYKEIIDGLFGLNAPEAVSRSFDQAVKLAQTISTSARGFLEPWAGAMQEGMKMAPQMAEGRPESFMNIFHAMFNAFDSTFGRVFHVPAVGKDREKIELLLRGLDDMSVYLAKNTEHQHMMYVTGLTAMEKVIEAITRKIREGEELKDFDEFFGLWIDVNEKAFYALFKTEEFAKLQGELLDSSLDVRRHFFKLMELYLYDFPVALRSEMDDLYKTIYDLKKKVKSLEKELRERSAGEVVA